jgi:valyl-tRNA synthetase
MPARTPNLSLDSKRYEPQTVEGPIDRLWAERDVFRARPESKKPPFVIAIPPPNVTGRLHMGHALNNTIQDLLIRYKRMDGYDALWIPGTDHAGIATQTVVKKSLDAEGLDFKTLGREKVIERIWEWKKKYGDQILNQLRRMGCSCDWSRTRFTMDEGLSQAVRVAFKRLYDDGLIYRGKYIVNWCPVDKTALSDDEVETTSGGEPGHLWYFRYPLASGKGHVTIATTRPETMFGDSAIAVNPKDERYARLIGQKVRLPLEGREIPILADDYVDASFGTGCLKVTPAHDQNDFQIGLRHQLPQIDAMNDDATMSDVVPARFRGLDRFVCRKAVVAEMQAAGLVEKIEERMVPVGRSYRSKAIIEYRLNDQWFVKMKPLAEKALEASAAGRVRFFPERWDGIYRSWLANTRDWCISRQIWWGHRIPAWYHRTSGEILVDLDTPARVAADPSSWRQDEDVLDTWFSSALWPYSTLGWPEATPDFAKYYPTSVLSTAKDIIFFWVARMVMTGLYNAGDVPFRTVFIHPVVCDEQGETMSKSKGNGIDPLHVIEGATREDLEGPAREARPSNLSEVLARIAKTFPQGFDGVGADALRFTLVTLATEQQQISLALQKFDEIGRRFSNKVWNAARFALTNFADIPAPETGEAEPALEDRWILGALDRCVAAVRRSFDAFRFDEAAQTVYHFFWDELCDWYLELVKPRLANGAPAERRRVQLTLGEVLSAVMRLLHPIAPFLTEEIWGHLHPRLAAGALIPPGDEPLFNADLCATAPFPKDKGRFAETLASEFESLREIVRAVRNLRATAGLTERTAVEVHLRPMREELRAALRSGASVIERAAMTSSLTLVESKPERMATAVVEGVEVYVNLAAHMDVDAEKARLEKERQKIDAYAAKIEQKLANERFVAGAPADVVAAERERLVEAHAKRAKLDEALRELGS